MDENKVTDIEKNYLDQLENLKKQMETMVPGDKYNEVLAEHKRLTEEYINKRPAPTKVEKQLKPAAEYAKTLMENKFKTDKDFVETSLHYREAFMKETGKDPWGDNGAPSEDSKLVAAAFTKLLEEHGDNPSEFKFRLNSVLVDDPQLVNAIRMNKNKNKR